MEINPQQLISVQPTLNRLLRRRGREGIVHNSLSGLFKAVRKEARVSLIGDYPTMSFTLSEVQNSFPSHKWTKAQMYHAFKFCRFWEEEGRKQAYLPCEWRRYVKDE